MTIDEAIDFLEESKYSPYETPSSCTIDTAITIMHKYQQLQAEYKTDLKIILNRLKIRMKDRDEDNGGEPLNAVDRGYHLAYEHLCEEIDNLLKEVEDGRT